MIARCLSRYGRRCGYAYDHQPVSTACRLQSLGASIHFKRKFSRSGEDGRRDKGDLIIRIVLQPSEELHPISEAVRKADTVKEIEFADSLRLDMSCVYRELKHGRSGDEVRPGWCVN